MNTDFDAVKLTWMTVFEFGDLFRWASWWISSFSIPANMIALSPISVSTLDPWPEHRLLVTDWNTDYIDLIRDDPSRSLMGARQENWFYRSLSQSQERGATWRLIGNQIIFSRMFADEEGTLSGDTWDVSTPVSDT